MLLKLVEYKPVDCDMSSPKLTLDQIKLANLKRMMDEQKTYNAEIAKNYGDTGCTPQFISDIVNGKAKMGDEVINSLAKALDCDPIEFYRIDFLMNDWKGISTEAVRVLMEAKEILEGIHTLCRSKSPIITE